MNADIQVTAKGGYWKYEILLHSGTEKVCIIASPEFETRREALLAAVDHLEDLGTTACLRMHPDQYGWVWELGQEACCVQPTDWEDDVDYDITYEAGFAWAQRLGLDVGPKFQSS